MRDLAAMLLEIAPLQPERRAYREWLAQQLTARSTPTDEWEPWPCCDEDDPEAMGCMGEDDPDNWLSEADETEPEQWDWDVVA